METARQVASGGGKGGNKYAVKKRRKQKYVRTGRLGANTKVTRQAARQYTLTSRAPYARYVVGNAQGMGQAEVHKGRWPLLRQAVVKALERLQSRLTEAMKRSLRENGIGL